MGERQSESGAKLGPAAVLSEREIRLLLSTFSRRSPTAVRNRALVLLLWRSGLRVGEAIELERRDVRLVEFAAPADALLVVRKGKGGRSRTVGVHQEAQAALEAWLSWRNRLGLAHHRALFCTLSSHARGARLGSGYVREMLARHARRAGLEARVHPHAFRATLAVELAREGKPVAAIRDVLGHSNIATTDAYLRRVFPADAIDAVRDRGRARAVAELENARARVVELEQELGAA